ncbi:response regulator [Ancylobacter sp. SL191]|uniref:response regulator n=1 Tax=Ancylobacter sp. SL191 TaxID=2995166 RepID=UPI002270D329|nr:response regulator [Ancylobacter sp. SL191]WAC27023.1 response regulator [Ancylobacter sp. SL191]
MAMLTGDEAARRALCVLVIEDDAFIGTLYEDVLTEMGHRVCAIEATEKGAIAAAARFKPDLMIVDASLREGSGVAAVQEILRVGFVPHLFVSGDVIGVEERMSGAIVLRKPFLEHELARAIQRALSASPTS